MPKVKLSRLGACCLLLAFGFVSQADASPTTVPYSTTASGPFFFDGDTFSLTGQSSLLILDTVAPTINAINTARFSVAPSCFLCTGNTESLILSYNLTLDGVTRNVFQSATWTIGVFSDSFVTSPGSLPVLFVTGAGSWEVTLNPYSLVNSGGTQSLETTATFTPLPTSPTPEPGSMLLLGTGLLLAGRIVRRRVLSETIQSTL